MTESDSSQPFSIPPLEEIVSLLTSNVRHILESIENFNRISKRIDNLLNDIEEPLRNLVNSSGPLSEVAKNLGPLLSYLPKQNKPESGS